MELLPRADDRRPALLPDGRIVFVDTEGSSAYHDLTPRGGVAIDVFGTGKTSVKFNIGRYLEAAQNGGFFITNNPTGRLITTSARTWSDNDRDFVARPQPVVQTAQAPLRRGASSLRRGQREFRHNGGCFDAQSGAVTSGWGVRTGDWQWGAALQQQ